MSFEFSAKSGELSEILRSIALRVDALETDDDLCVMNIEQTMRSLTFAANSLAHASRRAFIAAEDEARQKTNLIAQLQTSVKQIGKTTVELEQP